MWGKSGRSALVAAALVAVQMVVLAGDAFAGPSVKEALRFASRTANRLCNDVRDSRFEGLEAAAKSWLCRMNITTGRLVVEVRYRGGSEGLSRSHGQVAGLMRQKITFDSSSHFFCGAANYEGFAALRMNCKRTSSYSDRRCAEVEIMKFGQTGGNNRTTFRRSFANVVELRPDDCAMMQNALNFIAERSRFKQSNSVEDFFTQ